jgi:hypothetical protein
VADFGEAAAIVKEYLGKKGMQEGAARCLPSATQMLAFNHV